MKKTKQKIELLLLILCSLFVFIGNAWSQISLPTAMVEGRVNTTDTDLNFNINITRFDYVGGDFAGDNGPDESAMYGEVVISGATRTGPTSFTDAFFAIRNPVDSFQYLTAQLKNIYFVDLFPGDPDWGGQYFYLNLELDSTVPSTLNLHNVVLNTDAAHPSRFIEELRSQLGANDILGMKLGFVVSGDITGTGSGDIFDGLIDGVSYLAPPTNTPPVADPGVNTSISSWQIFSTIINGTASDFDGDALQCRWLEGTNVLKSWTPAGTNGECPLNLIALSVGTHILTLEVSDTQAISSDDMILTIDNSAPHAGAGPGGTFEINSVVTLTGDVSDFDGDTINYSWKEGETVICSGIVATVFGGDPVVLDPPCEVSTLGLGFHTITLIADDGINLPVSQDITVKIIDTTIPTIAPIASNYLLWPPNHIMIDIAIMANASDNSGDPVTLSVVVTSNEPENGLGDGDTGPYDWTQPVIDQNTGRIDLQLRRERSGSGNGRVYTMTITATDSAGNSSTAFVNIGVPHDMSKKK